MHAPQIIMIVLLSLAVFRGILRYGEDVGNVNAWASLIGVLLNVGLLVWGGFFS